MTRANSSGQPAPRFVAGAVDLRALKQRAEAAPAGASGTGMGASGAAARTGSGPQSGSAIALAAPVNADTFEEDLVIRSTQVPVIVQLGSSASPSNDQMRDAFASAALAQVSDTADRDPASAVRWVFRYVDVDTVPEIAQAFGIQAIPTVIALAAGRPLTSFEGAQPSEQLPKWIAAIVDATAGKLPGLPAGSVGAGTGAGEASGAGETEDARILQAEDLMEAGDYAAAAEVYGTILDAEPVGSEVAQMARAARATALLLQRVGDASEEEAQAAIAAATAPIADAASAARGADHLLLRGDKAAAFDALIAVIRTTPGEERDAAKARLLDLFALFEPADPEVIAARTRMASALF